MYLSVLVLEVLCALNLLVLVLYFSTFSMLARELIILYFICVIGFIGVIAIVLL